MSHTSAHGAIVRASLHARSLCALVQTPDERRGYAHVRCRQLGMMLRCRPTPLVRDTERSRESSTKGGTEGQGPPRACATAPPLSPALRWPRSLAPQPCPSESRHVWLSCCLRGLWLCSLACLARQRGPLRVRPSLSMQETWRRSLPSSPAQGTAVITPMAR